MILSFSTTPTAKPARSYSPGGVHARHLGGLAADQRAAGLLAAGAMPLITSVAVATSSLPQAK